MRYINYLSTTLVGPDLQAPMAMVHLSLHELQSIMPIILKVHFCIRYNILAFFYDGDGLNNDNILGEVVKHVLYPLSKCINGVLIIQ